jgi:hypothetical protein
VTTRLINLSYALLLGGALLSFPGCDDSGVDSDCTGDQCDELDPSKAACKGAVTDGSGLGRDEATILTNNDQFARFLLREGTGCPTKTSEVMAKLIQTQDCGADANGSMVVNEGRRTTRSRSRTPTPRCLRTRSRATVWSSPGSARSRTAQRRSRRDRASAPTSSSSIS